MIDSHRFTRCSHFDSLILSNAFLCNFLLIFCFGWQLLYSCFLLFISTRQVRADLFLYFQIKCSSFFVKILSFEFCLVNLEYDAYLPVDHRLVYSRPKLLLLFLSLESGLKPSFLINILVSFFFCFWI